MNKQIDNAELAELYRRSCAQRGEAGVDADTLVAFVEGSLNAAEHERMIHLLRQSPQQADIVKLLAALAPASAQLAQAASQHALVQPSHLRLVASVPRHQWPAASAPARVRRAPVMRWLAAAAVVIAVVGAVGWQSLHNRHQPAIASLTPVSTPAPADTIFNADMNGNLATSVDASDQIFSSSFRRQKRG